MTKAEKMRVRKKEWTKEKTQMLGKYRKQKQSNWRMKNQASMFL